MEIRISREEMTYTGSSIELHTYAIYNNQKENNQNPILLHDCHKD